MDSRNGITINFNQDIYRWIVKMVEKAKKDPLNYSNSTFGGFVQACVAKAKKEYEEKGSEIQKLNKRVLELENQIKRIDELENKIKELEK
ncbi:hypothetical protein [Brachyspira hyodysenteriae]|uniref:hypothetical protein n=1 Tax=Brachyspira hyodysenteriae TaxID=159 RepID=UPI00063DB7DC|nr:hypothetical protein [Brachyspira hyodysenteriae]KLI18265.1 hypothetical protein SU45_02935 [Brachyspira hyodysenteriae]KLI22331.1 hypothetical protein SU43_08450 [Brachyspira hyodysenteriae]KLI62691.1 hypothetical protein SZ46_00670 [Brachyspira hyodysenteriae]TVL62701.1 hypothetical protein A9X85_00495 [Brachyspira hyodysenteriae]TVL83509.1 hypothetical protein A9X80_00390 [Brachyspira hyodysenteriae]